MAILILLVCFITLFFSAGILINPSSKKELIISTALVFCGFVVLITELLSLFYLLTFWAVLFSWTVITVINMVYLSLQKDKVRVFYYNLKDELNEVYQRIKARKFYEKALLVSVLLILLLVFIQGVVYPPNNWDSMDYHLARIPSWISHQTVAHYPTHVAPQIYQPPFAEFLVMHFNILNRADYFSSAVQFSLLLLAVAGIVAIVESFGLDTSYKILAVFLALTIPEVILQATSTQNDMAVASFVVTAFYFAIKSIRKFSAKNAFFFGLAVGLGILTKATAYIYMPAILLIFGVTMVVRLVKTKNYNNLLYALLAGFMFLIINIGFYTRNYQLTKSFLGVDNKEYGTYSNEKMNPKLMLSSMIKNAGVHIGLYHLKPLSVFSAHEIIKVHEWAGIDINDPANNFFADKYDTLYNPDHEDAAPNFIHLILITLSLLVIIVKSFKKQIQLNAKLLTFTILFQGLFFCFYLKYQPFHTRLHTSMFLLAVPLICYALSLIRINLKRLFYWSAPLIFLYALLIVLGNLNTPYNAKIKESRYEKYFISKPWFYHEYQNINHIVNEAGYKNIGLIMGTENWDYSLFTNCYSKAITPVYINVKNYTNKSHHFNNNVDCIISTISNEPFIDYFGKRFYNQNPNNKFIHLFKLKSDNL